MMTQKSFFFLFLPDRGKVHINLYQMDYKVRDLLIVEHKYHLQLYLLIVKVHLNDDLSIKVLQVHVNTQYTQHTHKQTNLLAQVYRPKQDIVTQSCWAYLVQPMQIFL